jgi:hypothetical protein
VCVAPAPVRTDVARGLLPELVSHQDAAANAGRSALLVAALTQPGTGPDVLLDATRDWLHQDYRVSAMSHTHALVRGLRAAGLPAVVSGAGPSVLAFLPARDDADYVRDLDSLGSIVRETGIAWHISSLDVERQGAHVLRPEFSLDLCGGENRRGRQRPSRSTGYAAAAPGHVITPGTEHAGYLRLPASLVDRCLLSRATRMVARNAVSPHGVRLSGAPGAPLWTGCSSANRALAGKLLWDGIVAVPEVSGAGCLALSPVCRVRATRPSGCFPTHPPGHRGYLTAGKSSADQVRPPGAAVQGRRA